MGPTAAGKTDWAMRLADRYPVDLISVDSALVYREMDIGTAKPSPDLLQRYPHRLVNILDPAETYSAGRFCADALREMEAIRNRGRIPLLVGGTMLYYRALRGGLAQLPQADAPLRARLESDLQRLGSAQMHARLAQIDPPAAARIHPNDPQRIQRALEVFELTGRPLSELQRVGDGERLGYQLLPLVVSPPDRSLLHQRIALRFDAMLEAGFLDEVTCLRNRGDLHADLPSMRAVGYRQVWAYLDGKLSFPEMRDRGIIATRQLAKRQLTWLRADTDARWIDPTVPGGESELWELVADFLAKGRS